MFGKPLEHIQTITTLSRQELEDACRQNVKSIYLGEHLLLCKMLTKYKMYVDSRDVGVVPNLLMDGYWESWITKFIARLVQPGHICIDAGANFGYYSLLMAELAGREGKVLAVEPNSSLCRLLRFTSSVNEYSYRVVQKALADTSGEITLSVPVDFWGGGTIRPEKVDDHVTEEKVQTVSMDELVELEGLPRVDFIKMDCEGVEPMILAGMEKTLEQNPQLKMVMEYSPFMYKDVMGFTKYLFDRFEVGAVEGDSQVRKFTHDDINYLVELGTHIDLFMQQKKM
ncbi:MAG TPA: FkbM family methyltransferase [Chitinophagaceae bacterium]